MANKKLYKYIGFDRPYWSEPLIENRLFFSSIEQLRVTNDVEEFKFSMNSDSSFFSIFDQIPQAYEQLFSKTRIICVSKGLSKACMNRFCSCGEGICYEFIFDEAQMASDITGRDVVYSNSKELNVPKYLIENTTDLVVKGILKKDQRLTSIDNIVLLKWMATREPNNILIKHISEELAFKKHRQAYEEENEYRFVHLSEPVGNVHLKTHIVNSKLDFSSLGLQLNRIYTSDIEKVRACSPLSANVQIDEFP